MEENKKKKVLIWVLFGILGLLIATIIIVACVLLTRGDDPANTDKLLVPDYPPQEADPNQSPMENEPDGTLETQVGGTGVNITYTTTAKAYLSDSKVELYCANPSKSLQDMVITLVVDDVIICRSQRVTPGNQIKSLALDEEAKEVLAEGTYTNAQFLIGCYDPETSEKAALELAVDVDLTVVE